MNINFGVKDLDRDGVGGWDPEDMGKLVWDADFTVTPVANQQAIMDLCNALKANTELVKDPFGIKCWILDMDDLQPANEKLPISDATNFEAALTKFATTTQAGIDHVSDFNLGFEKSTGKLKFMKIVVPSKGEINGASDDKKPFKDGWDKVVTDFVASAPNGLKYVYQEAGQTWAFMRSEKAFADGVAQGVSIAILLAFLIMLISTQNVFIALYAIITVGLIVLTIVGFMKMNDYELGSSESVAMVIIIGFSVDYVVHLGAHYVHKKSPDRTDRTSDALGSMGVSIFSGGMTTLGSGVFLFGGQIAFFQKFALIISSTVIVSLAFALIFFTSFLHAFGPEH